MLLDAFIQHTLASIDDLAELKVSLVALRLLELKQSETASVTEQELAAHPTLRDGLGFAPEIALNGALQRAVARGTLLRTTSLVPDEPRYFANNEPSRRILDAIESSEARLGEAQQRRPSNAPRLTAAILAALAREIEWLEMINAYPIGPDDERLVEEWLAQGYTQDEILAGAREALSVPRARGTPARGLADCSARIMAQPPLTPTAYYRHIVARTEPPPDEIIAFRELAGRWPGGREFNLVQAAVGIFGARATIETMKRTMIDGRVDVDDIIPLLAEQEEAELALAREQAVPDLMLRELVQLYESAFGLPPTSHIAQDIGALAADVTDLAVWRGAFQYAAAQNKRDWAYVRRLLMNPSPALFEPQPANETARFAFNEYKRRIGKGSLPVSVAGSINQIATQVTDPMKWSEAFEKAEKANSLRWDYIEAILISPRREQGAVEKARRSPSGPRAQSNGARRPKTEYTPEERAAAEERAQKQLEEIRKQRSSRAKPG
jgi:hypothetical protein